MMTRPRPSSTPTATAVRDAEAAEIRIYRNGELAAVQGNVGTGDLSSPGEPLYIGAKLRENAHATTQGKAPVDHHFDGELDDLKLFDRVLTQEEILGAAGLGELYRPITSPAEIYDAEEVNSRKVNFKDYAILAGQWLEERLWP